MSRFRFTDWINSTGGPLVAFEEKSAHKWTGIQGDPSDYEIACQAKGYVDMVHLHGSEILVFGDEPLQTLAAYCETSILIVRWMWAESEHGIFSEIEKIDLNNINYVESMLSGSLKMLFYLMLLLMITKKMVLSTLKCTLTQTRWLHFYGHQMIKCHF